MMNIFKRMSIMCILVFLFVFLLDKTHCKKIRKVFKHAKEKERVLREVHRIRRNTGKLCANPKRKGDKLYHLVRHTRDTSFSKLSADVKNAVYFSGKEILKLKAFYSKIPSDSFTLSIMLNPEGGQHDPVTVLEVIDSCNGKQTNNWLTIGIGSNREVQKSGQRIFVTLKTERSKQTSTIYTNSKYTPGRWVRISVTFNSTVLKLFVHDTLVAVNYDQKGPVFPEVSNACKTLLLGGDEDSKTFYRGYITDLEFWNYAQNTSELKDGSYNDLTSDRLFVHDSFKEIKKWRSLFKTPPRIVNGITTSRRDEILLKAPLCGETICDDPTLVNSYRTHKHLQDEKEISYRVFNIMNDDGLNPQITKKLLQKQHQALTDAFAPYNISFKLDTKGIRNSFLRKAVVLYTCDLRSIGDDVCDEECLHPKIGNDGGDCDHLLPVVPECKSKDIRNGHCDQECNKFVWDWDGGDCCTEGSELCFDPRSEHRSYLSKDEFKAIVGEEGSGYLNIYLASTVNSNLAGISTYPWDKDVYGTSGGIVIPPESFGSPEKLKILVHEIGHIFGLWHVHHGISEMDCNNPCLETHASTELGDLCSDTEPTPDNTECHDPDGTKPTCGVQTFKNTPYKNYMSYADDSCIDHFTPEQRARMHCYLDLVYQPWKTNKKPSPVPMSPKVTAATNDSITMIWLPPLGSRKAFPETICDICINDRFASQFASNATASHTKDPLFLWQPEQATGPPDAEPCKTSDRAWMMPDVYTCEKMECYIDLEFNFKIVPNKLSVWVTYAGSLDEDTLKEMDDAIKLIEITTDDDKIITLGEFPVSCDSVLTIRLDVKRSVKLVRIYVPHPYTAIDAVQLSAEDSAPECRSCRHLKYRITRDPAFPKKDSIQTSDTEFTDKDLEPDIQYTYTVTVIRGNHESVPSPSLQYTIGQVFCGDGKIDRDEECDDGNSIDGDGCDLLCKEEELFKCKGEPSQCYIHNGDGICEEFEKPYSVADCGYYTPVHFEDQWATSAIANPDFQDVSCPESLVTGIPLKNQKCASNTVPKEYWNPCKNNGKEDKYWIEVYFARPKVATEVIIHLGSDGIDGLIRKQTMRVDLLTSDNTTKATSPELHSISCSHNPVNIPIVHNLAQPFFLTKGIRIRFSSPRISIASVRIRSAKYLDPVTIASCKSMEMYDPISSRCLTRSCEIQSCGNLRVKHGVPSCNGFKEGNVCTVTCNPGFILDGLVNEYICVNGTWQTYSPLSCIRVHCGKPFFPYASISCPDGFSYGDKCNFFCKAPAKLQGDVSTIQCDADGRWTLPNAFCQIQCKAPSVTSNSRLMTMSCKRGYQFLGKICKFKCEKGFKVEGRNNVRKIYKLECGEDGSWHGDSCVSITCSAPDVVFKGLYRCSDGYNAGSKCTMVCPDDLAKQVITCQIDGAWTNHFNLCSSSINGTCPRVNDNKHVKFECNGNSVGDQCEVHCFLPNAVPILNGQSNKVRGRLAGIADQEDENEAFGKVTCSALLEWTPDPETVSCKVGCNKDYINDGLCQAEYNTPECSYDGGDCCSSTVFDKLVISIPFNCGKPCSCIDPNAEENQKDKAKSRGKISRSRYQHLALSRYSKRKSQPYWANDLS